jgi:hypothetical protein
MTAVSFGAAALFDEDVATLAPGGWLTDAVLTLHCELIEAAHGPTRVRALHPSVSLLALLEADADDLRATLTPLALHVPHLILVPINDSADPNAGPASGSHWSLLAWRRGRPAAAHYDSGRGGANIAVARRVWGRLAPLAGAPSAVVPAPCPQQTDASSCGVIVAALAEALAAAGGGGGDGDGVDVHALLAPGAVDAHRRRMRAQVAALVAGAEPAVAAAAAAAAVAATSGR